MYIEVFISCGQSKTYTNFVLSYFSFEYNQDKIFSETYFRYYGISIGEISETSDAFLLRQITCSYIFWLIYWVSSFSLSIAIVKSLLIIYKYQKTDRYLDFWKLWISSEMMKNQKIMKKSRSIEKVEKC